MTVELVVVESAGLLLAEAPEPFILAPEAEVVVFTGGEAGPPGASSVGAPSTIDLVADGAISGHRVVRPTAPGEVGYADSGTIAHANGVLGLTINAAIDGDTVRVQTAGRLTEPTWAWTIGLPVFLGAAGNLTQTPPAAGFQLVVAVAVAADTLVIGIKQPIVL
jgi:hypothetical protein